MVDRKIVDFAGLSQSEDTTINGGLVRSGSPVAVNWSAAEELLEAIASASPGDAHRFLDQMFRDLLLPLWQLEDLGRRVSRVLDGDERAAADLRQLLEVSEARGLFDRGAFDRLCSGPVRNDAERCACEATTPGSAPHVLDAEDILQESEITGLMLSVAAAARSGGINANTALDFASSTLARALPIVSLARARRMSGLPGLLSEMRALAGTGQLHMGGVSGLGVLEPPASDERALLFPRGEDDELVWSPKLKPIGKIKVDLGGPKHWDLDYWKPFSPLEIPPVFDEPPGLAGLLACTREVARRLRARSAIPVPPRPSQVVWAHGIASVEQTGHCPGDRAIIRGTGFTAMKGSAILLMPSFYACRPVAVPDAWWTDTAITAELPDWISSGPVGFADAAYVDAYSKWQREQDQLLEELKAFACFPQFSPPKIAPPFADCPPDIGVNRLRAGRAVIAAFTVNGSVTAFVEPETPLVLDWSVRNAETVTLTRRGSNGPGFNGASSIADPPEQRFHLGPFQGDTPRSETYEIEARGPCGTARASATVQLCRVPTLRITGIEVTQGIQKFRSTDGPDNSLPLVAAKDTIVRVYAVADNMGGFKSDWVNADTVKISGELRAGSLIFKPLNANSAVAGPDLPSKRGNTDGTLNFRIPGAGSEGMKTLRVKVWTRDELPSPPTGDPVRPTTPFVPYQCVWHHKRAFKVRYVRVSQPMRPALSDDAARAVILRAFDLLATPPLDIAPARVPVWHTGENLATKQGIANLLDDIDDQHDCTLSEALFPWEDECPDDDHAVWVAVTPVADWGGMAQTWHPFNTSRNTAVVPPDPIVAAHELGHTLRLNHVNVGGFDDDEDFDVLPNGGAIAAEDAMDPFTAKMMLGSGLTGFSGLYDVMTYAQHRWISPANWKRIFDKF